MTIAIITESGVRKVAPLVVVAQQAAAAAQLYAQIAASAAEGNIYPDYATGNAATTSGQYFFVAASGSYDLYVHGTGAPVAKLPTLDLSSGYLGVGTSSPISKLHVSGTNATIATIESTNAGATDTQLRILTPDRDWRIGQNVGGIGVGSLIFFDINTASARFVIDGGGILRPGADNTQSLGAGSYRWSVVYAGTGTINTSDEREKTWRGAASPAEIAAARRIIAELGFYQWNDAIADKGEDGARYHFGPRAQRVWAIMADEGLIEPIVEGVVPSSAYAFLCFDAWEAAEPVESVAEVRDDDGNVVVAEVIGNPGRDAGDRFGVRTDQLALFLIAVQEARIAALEA